MTQPRLLSYICNEKLYECVEQVIYTIKRAQKEKNVTLHANVIDPFSAIFDAMYNKISLQQWLELEKTRQIQKTLQNNIGLFHQSIIGCVDGWENLGTGKIIDLINVQKKIIAEIKNKYNTTKGNHKIAIYDDLEAKLENYKDKGYIAYYVEIIRKKPFGYCETFTPSDNKTHQKRKQHPQIKIIDGETFYSLATGSKTALVDLYRVLPSVISKISGHNLNIDDTYYSLFEKAYNITP